jgi:membrane protein DedA with SNARE-associated domain
VGQLITNWVTSGGLAAVLILMAVESCGIPFPSEVIMPVAGAFAAGGHLNVVLVVIFGALGNLIGSLVAYVLAARYGRPLLLGPGRRIGISPAHIELADRFFERYGLAAVFFSRMLPVVRTYISFPAGLARVQPIWFAILTFAGAVPWCIALTLVGYQIGANYDRVSGPITKVAIGIAVVVVLVVVWWYLRGRRAAARRRTAA